MNAEVPMSAKQHFDPGMPQGEAEERERRSRQVAEERFLLSP